ncbi:uncharacterized protein LOC142761716 isoform X2 [Rhipicephalus microplus]|uniref:uncharacterized protein LOC142761716 isoform X2 n=1 Tax=Rhipicephalus microplus TaxID=6941 RepID=UPI003F6CC5F3
MAAIDRPAVLKQMVSATLPTSADARGPQRTCDPHCESPDLRVTPHLQAEKKQGPCLASRTSRCSPACPAEEDRPVYSCSPAGPSSKPGSGTATQLLFCWSDPDVVELQPESSIFVETGALHAVLNSAKTPTALARGLLPAVFNWHALLTCSMKGQKAKGMHKPVTQRPPLHAAAIDAILAYTKSTARGKGWECSEKLLVPSMGTKLAELRAEEKICSPPIKLVVFTAIFVCKFCKYNKRNVPVHAWCCHMCIAMQPSGSVHT